MFFRPTFDNKSVTILDATTIQDFLASELTRRVKVNPRYSQRGFARSLGLSPGELSEILRGKRRLGLKAALKVAQSLGLNSVETKHLVHLTQVEKSRTLNMETPLTAEAAPLKANQLNEDIFHLLSDWSYFAVLNLMDCVGFEWKAIWIAKRLGLTRMQASVIMDRLLRLGMVKNENGRMRGVHDYALSPSGVSSEAIRSYHRQMLQKAIQALDLQNVTDREISGIGFAVDPLNLGSIKKEISEFLDELAAKYSKGKRTDVYQLEVAFFKLTEGAES